MTILWKVGETRVGGARRANVAFSTSSQRTTNQESKMKPTSKTLVLAVVAMSSLIFDASATTITFNGTAPEGGSTRFGVSGPNFFGPVYSEGGFTITPTGEELMFFVDNTNPTFPGVASFDDDMLIFNSQLGTYFVLTRDDGNPFDLVSVRTGSLGNGTADDGSFTFTGFFAGGGSISQTVLGIGASPGTSTFTGFTNLASVTVSSLDGFFPIMDDLTVTRSASFVSDGGSTIPLLGLALAGLIAFRRKLK